MSLKCLLMTLVLLKIACIEIVNLFIMNSVVNIFVRISI